MKKAIYTVITNSYDTLKEPKIISKGFDYICFTDNPDLKSRTWKIIFIDRPSKHLQREIKIKTHEFLPDYDITIYVDGNMVMKRDMGSLVSNGQLLFIHHSTRNCVYKEGEAVIGFRKDSRANVDKQIEAYKSEGMPFDFGMYQTGIIVRRKTRSVIEFCNFWWAELEKYSHRDQLSVTYAVWKTGIKPLVMESKTMGKYVAIFNHNYNYYPKVDYNDLKVFYSTPARSDKNIGLAYNEFMSTVPDDAWVCLRDGDTMFTTPDWPKHIEDIIIENGNKFELIGCMTNRLRGKHQLVDGMFEEESITKHLEAAKDIRSNEVVSANGIAGLCLIFRKSLWDKVKFKENSIYFDTEFCNAVRNIGGRIGVAKGLYLIHLYRWGQENPTNYVKHLL